MDDAVVNEDVDAYFIENICIEEEVGWDNGDIAEKLEKNPTLQRSRAKEKISAIKENLLNALRLYYTDLLKGKGKVETSLRIARSTFQNRGTYMARVIRGWAKPFAKPGSLPPHSERCMHKKQQSALALNTSEACR
ncbi:hypothetical protein V1525DRAFT_459619 [Lipomyces kononenkoae]|uniref:Uncharacterized protein n=1 Tax=Lipomyces kononenkoae TaxID=34357 RepID=A0ACC3SRM1_LIPKO